VGLPDDRFDGKVTNIDSRIDPATRSVIVRAEIPNRDGELRPGMFMTVVLHGAVPPTLLLPDAAIVPEQGHTSVFVVEGHIAARREVKTGRRLPGEVAILSGLKEGERVVVDGTQNLAEGSRVTDAANAAAAVSS
jgi:membrane fusion protein (multidrug efflux system)